jgi:hypothetical protein
MKITLQDFVIKKHGFVFGVGETSAQAKMNAAKILPAAIEFPAYQVARLVSYDPSNKSVSEKAVKFLGFFGLELDI